MRPAQSSVCNPIPDVRPAALEKRRLRDLWVVGLPGFVSVVALCHLAMCSYSPQPTMGIQPHRIIRLNRSEHQVLAPTKESRSEPAVVADGEPAFNPARLPEPGPSWPYDAGWR
jgi:hypothetical protein